MHEQVSFSPQAQRPDLPPDLGQGLRQLGAWALLGALWGAYAVMLVLFVGSVCAPWLLRGYLQQEASKALDREIRLDSARVNPFTGRVRLEGFRMASRHGVEPLASFDVLDIAVGPVSLARGRLNLRGLHLENPVVRLSRDASGAFNVDDLLPSGAQRQGESRALLEFTAPGMAFALSDVTISGGALIFEDALTGTSHEVRDLHFSLDSFASGQSGLREAFDTGGLVNGASVRLAVKADLYAKTPRVEARLTVTDLSLKRYSPYLPLKHPLDLSVAEAGVLVRATLGRSGGLEGEARLAGAALRAGDAGHCTLETLEVQGIHLRPETLDIGVERVEITSPELEVGRDQNGHIGLLDALETARRDDAAERPTQAQAQAQAQARAGAQTGLPSVRVDAVALRGGKARLRDEGLGVTATLDNLRLDLAGLETSAGRFASLTAECGGSLFDKLKLQASGGYLPLDMRGELSVEGLDFGKQLPTLKRLLPRMTLDGVAALKTGFALKDDPAQVGVKLTTALDVTGLKVQAEGQAEPLAQARSLSFSGLELDLTARRLSLGQLALAGGGAALQRTADGRLPALEALMPTGGQAAGAPSKPWSISAGQVRVSDFNLLWQDAKTGIATRAALAEGSLRDVGVPQKPVGFGVKGVLDAQAAFDVSGELTGVGFGGEPQGTPGLAAKLSLSGVDLAQAARMVPGLPVAVLSGRARAEGSLTASLGKGDIRAAFSGGAGLESLALARPGSSEPWLSVAGVNAGGLTVQLSPPEFKAQTLVLDRPNIKLTLGKDGKPLSPLAAPENPAAPPAKPTGKDTPGDPQAPAYEVASLQLLGGEAELTFPGAEPPFVFSLRDLAATLANVRPGQKAGLTASAALGRTGAFKAQGGAGVGDGPLTLDLKATLENLDLGELSPVSRAFTGFPVTRGKLALNMDYKADAKGLDLKNHIVVTGLQLGRKNQEPGAKDVPLDLAVSLLTDAKGVIDLDIPVKGAPESAKVDLHDVISTAVGGAITKVLFSPLAFLNVAGGGGSTAYAPFIPGTEQLTPEARKTLASLGGALTGRPRLNVEITTYVDPAAEAEAYSAHLAEQARVHAAKEAAAQAAVQAGGQAGGRTEKPVARKGGQAPPPAAEPSPAPAQPQRAPTAEEWAKLARKRMEVVWLALTQDAGLPGARVFPVTGEVSAPPKVQGQPGNRADVRLRN